MMGGRYDRVAALALAALGAGCGAAPGGGPLVSVSASAGASRAAPPLVGKIWDVKHARVVSEDEVDAALERADFVVLGEKHDDPAHHALQARALAALVARGKRPALALEMVDADQQPAIDAWARAPGATASAFGAAVAWEKRGWPTYTWYEPIVKVAVDARLPIVAANLPLDEVRELVHHGTAALPEAQVKLLGLDRPLPPDQESAVEDEMRALHCGQLPDEMLAPMALAQRARDAQMGAAMLAASKGRPVVLIAGDGHARTDRGVPAFLAQHAPGGSVIVSVGFVEADPTGNTPDREPYDFVEYTARANDEDPCAKMKAMHR